MKALVFSDIHGSAAAANLVKEQVEKHHPDSILLLGDILYHGPRNPLPDNYNPKETASILNTLAADIIAINGNCDSEVDSMVLSFPLAPVFSWVLADGYRLFLSHGHTYNPEKLPNLKEGDIFLFGHTHIPKADCVNGIYLCNPGSLSLPKEGHPKSYGIFEDGIFSVLTDGGETYLRLACC